MWRLMPSFGVGVLQHCGDRRRQQQHQSGGSSKVRGQLHKVGCMLGCLADAADWDKLNRHASRPTEQVRQDRAADVQAQVQNSADTSSQAAATQDCCCWPSPN